MISDTLRDAFGVAGGILLAIAAAPQLFIIWKRKSADDVSMLFLLTYAIGLILTVVYLILIEAWAAAIPGLVEVAMALALILSKIFIKYYYKELRMNERSEGLNSLNSTSGMDVSAATLIIGSRKSIVDGPSLKV